MSKHKSRLGGVDPLVTYGGQEVYNYVRNRHNILPVRWSAVLENVVGIYGRIDGIFLGCCAEGAAHLVDNQVHIIVSLDWYNQKKVELAELDELAVGQIGACGTVVLW